MNFKPIAGLTKTLLIVKLIIVLLTVSFLSASGAGTAQTVTLQEYNVSLKVIFDKIHRQTGYEFVWDKQVMAKTAPVTVNLKQVKITEALEICLASQQLDYEIVNNIIAISRKPIVTDRLADADTTMSILGRVLSNDKKEPLEGVSIFIRGTSRGTVTDVTGSFQIKANRGDVLEFSSAGFITQLHTVNSTYITISLKVAVEGLDQAVVVGYGVQSRRNVTGAIAKVTDIKAEENITANVFSTLQGKVAGLNVQHIDGAPGTSPAFNIRGSQTTSLFAYNPLIVVDGMIVDAGLIYGTTNNPSFNISNINPQDIESVEVLKDASSSAIYGARGAQGVIVITTKRGKLNTRPVVNVSSYYGITKQTLGFRALNNQQYEMMFKEARQNRIGDIQKALDAGNLTPQQITQLNQERNRLNNEINNFQLGSPAGLADIDWVDKITPNSAGTYNIQANISGGSEGGTYYFSFGKYSEENSAGPGKFTRYTGKLALTQKINKWLRLGGDFSATLSQSDNLVFPVNDAIALRPDTPDSLPVNEDGSYGYWFGTQKHPYAIIRGNTNTSKLWNYLGNVFAEATIMPALTFRSAIAGVKSESDRTNFTNPFAYDATIFSGMYGSFGDQGIQYTLNNILTYKLNTRSLKGELLLGQEYFSNKNESNAFGIQGFPLSEGLWQPGNGTAYSNDLLSMNRNYQETGESYFFRSSLSWDNKYLLSASIRRDGSSKLTGDNRYSWFPSASVGWIISDETFFGKSSAISFLKIKAGAGLTGNIRTLGYFDFADLATTASYNGSPALMVSSLKGNPDLRWERTKQFDAGVEAKLFDNHVSATLEFYKKRTDGLLTSLPLPYSTGGYGSQRGNLGVVDNSGIDLDINYASRPIAKGAFEWSAGMVLNVNKNRIVSLRDSVLSFGYFIPGGPRTFVKTGQSVGAVLLYRSLGVDPNTGDMIYLDRNKDGRINTLDQEYIPVAQPKLTGGFNLSAAWKGFSIAASLSFSAGSKIYNLDDQLTRVYSIDFTGVMKNKIDWALDRWTKPGDESYYPRAVVGVHGAGQTTDWNTRPSTQYLFSASYLRFRNVTLAYQIPGSILSQLRIPAIRVHASCQNLFIVKDRKLKMSDPEVGLAGLQQAAVPLPRTVAFGIDITL